MDQLQRLVHLLVSSGPDKGKMFFVKPKREAIIGRAAACDLRLTDPGASQKHCIVRSAGDIVFIEDLNSRNGTFVNGEKTTRRVLDENGKLKIGSSVIELTWVETEKSAPVTAVESAQAPTLIEASGNQPVGRHSAAVPSTVLDANQLKDFRAAREMLGKSVAGFLLLETLGVGDIGVVFRAKAVKGRDQIALALIPKESVKAPEMLTRFLSETQTNLQIPNALRLLAAGQEGDYGYIATEVMKGRDLESVLDAGRAFNLAQTMALLEPIFEALKAAHAAGVVHGDVRPANILLTDNERAVLLGLGLGPRSDSEGKSIFVKKDESVGRLGFQAPELTRAKPAAPASDVFSLGATLYCVLSHQWPFEAPTKVELIRKIRWEDLPMLNTVEKDIPVAFANVIAKAMNKEAPTRFESIADFQDALKKSAG